MNKKLLIIKNTIIFTLKDILYFIPFIISFYCIFTMHAMRWVPSTFIWLGLLYFAGILLCKNILWGGYFCIIPTLWFIYISKREWTHATCPYDYDSMLRYFYGILILIYYIVCTCHVHNKIAKSK